MNTLTFEPKGNYSPGKFWTYRAKITLQDCPHLLTPDKAQERRNIEDFYGKNNPFVRSMIYGEFQRSSEFNLIFDERHLALLERFMSERARLVLPGDLRAAGDISGGGDGCVFMVREGTRVIEIDDTQKADELLQAEYWVEKLQKRDMKPYQFCMDGGGIGSTVAKYMKRLGFSGISLFMANNSPLYKFQFKDRYTELHWLVRDMLTLQVLELPRRCEKLLRDANKRRFVRVGSGDTIKTEPKEDHRKREGWSPDYLDTLVYLLNDFTPSQLDQLVTKEEAEEQKAEQQADSLSPIEVRAQEQGDDSFQGIPDLSFWGHIGR